jgi:hypothetical protein
MTFPHPKTKKLRVKKKLTLLLLLSVACIKILGQNKSSLPDPKSETRLEHILDSVSKAPLENLKITDKPDMPVHIICTCSANTSQPLFLLKSHHRTFVLDSISMLNPNWIGNIYITKKQSEIAQYGTIAKAGIVVIILDDKDHPEGYKDLKHRLKKVRPNFNVPKVQSKSTEIFIR